LPSVLRILHLEDDLDDAELVRRMLAADSLDCEITRVDTRADFQAAIERGGFDLILADYSLRSFDGLSALAQARRVLPSVPFILVSGSLGEERAVESLRDGATDYVLKERLARMPEAVRRALREAQERASREQAQAALWKSEAQYRTLVEAAPDGIVLADLNGRIAFHNSAYYSSLGHSAHEISQLENFARVHPDDLGQLQAGLAELHASGHTLVEYRIQHKDGRWLSRFARATLVYDEQRRPVNILTIISDVTDRQQAEEALRQSELRFRVLIENAPDAITLVGSDGRVSYVSPSAIRLLGYSAQEAIGQMPARYIHPDDLRRVYRRLAEVLRKPGHIAKAQYRYRHKNGEWRWLESTISNLLGEPGVAAFVFNFQDITERKRAEDEIRDRLAELEAVNHVSTAMRSAQTLDVMLSVLLDTTLEILNTGAGSISLYDPLKDELRIIFQRGLFDTHAPYPPQKPGTGITGHVFATGQPYLSSNFKTDVLMEDRNRHRFPPGGGVCVPIRAGENVIGTFIVILPPPRETTPSELRFLTTLCEIAGNAIQRTTLHQQTQRRMEQLSALRLTDQAINSSFDVRLSLTIILSQVIAQLRVDAAAVLLFNASSQMLTLGAGQGFRTDAPAQVRLRLGEGYAGRAVLERRTVHVPNVAAEPENPRLAQHLAAEGIVTYHAVPLMAKGQPVGVLEIFQRSPLEPDEDWLDFLTALAGQAAIAIDNAALFENLQRTSSNLAQAYDATIEGWSRALDLRDKDTEGHTRRVADMTVQLASLFDLNADQLAQVRWGALLHDIGKMGIPDNILLKPGPLTDEQWVLMRKHPVLAYEMLSPIQYLRAALDIPYRHHEKWDGTGYPLGLSGERIPLAARVFSVVDVWDALRSDRPYRKAWPDDQVIAHLRSLSGTHFDPRVLAVCLDSGLLTGQPRSPNTAESS
jgi:PAS domain S-box-containing protein/putative nucleotidyltransferase with HDIG domain